jgi:hypothetical protein
MLLDNINSRNRPHLVTYLFPESFISHLETMSIKAYEDNFYKKDKRTIICIFDLSGYIKSDFLVVFGRKDEDGFEDFFTKSLSNELRQRYKNIKELRDDRQSGSFSTYLIPDQFNTERNSELDDYKMHIINQLKSFQALLSVIYLASRVDLDGDKYKMEYKGLKLTKMEIEREKFLNLLPYSGEIYKVYQYAYDGFSRDKLDLSEYFISLISNGNINSFCENTKNIIDAIKSGYNDVLLKRTKEYFDARQKVQDEINDFIKDVSENTVNLTKEVAKEAYTITGVVALGIVGTILKPDLNPWMTALAISVVILFYSHLALWYYLKTLKQSQDLKIEQSKAYIESFKDILGNIGESYFINNENIKKSNILFVEKYNRARDIYGFILCAALLVMGASALVLLITSFHPASAEQHLLSAKLPTINLR